jgi:5-methyltetrahydrofolate--homocysteine methyltransferase
MNSYKELVKSIVEGNEERTVSICRELLAAGVEPKEIIKNGLIPGMDAIGLMFKSGEKYIPNVLMSAAAVNSSVKYLKPYMCGDTNYDLGTIIVGTVKGDIHDIGKRLVSLMLESSGFKVVDLGTDISKGEFVNAIREHKAVIVAMSAMLTSAMNNMKSIIKAIQAEDFGHEVLIMIGGAPVTHRFAKEMNAHFSENAIDAREKALEHIKKNK